MSLSRVLLFTLTTLFLGRADYSTRFENHSNKEATIMILRVTYSFLPNVCY